MSKKHSHSIEETIETWAKMQLKSIKAYPKTDFINSQLEKALKEAPSKKGGKGGNYPDIKCLLSTPEGDLPVMIEVKGKEGDLIKLNADSNTPDNLTKKGDPNFTNISKYAVNGAVHYANAILRNTTYKKVLAIGVNGYYDKTGQIFHEVSTWYLSRHNLFIPKELSKTNDLSFLLPQYQQALMEKMRNIELTEEEVEQQKTKLEDDIERKLKDLNQRMEDEMHIVVNQRVQLVTGLIMAGLGVKENNKYKVMPVLEEDLHGDDDEENSDGAIIMRKVKSYLRYKKLPAEKIDLVVKILSVVFQHSQLEKAINGESILHTLYHEIKEDIIPFLTGELHDLDFTGRLFNVLNAWVAVPDGDKNDVVLTPRHTTELMARLCQVNKDSYVWDFATGSAGFLISAMHQMIADAEATISSPDELRRKINHIKMEQLLGIEKLAEIYVLAVLNMILMKDGSANIIRADSLTEFNGNYEQGELKGKPFPANVFLLNPPYSASGKGFVFVQKALGMMTHGGMAAILIQENAGNGNGLPYTKEILKNNTLVASIKMPIDLFIGKSSVQTSIYVFEVDKPHNVESVVKFIDFSNDGFTRMSRRHSSQNVNLRDTGNAHERYAEIVKLVRYGKGVNNENLNYFRDSYIEDYITLNGNDWTYSQHKKIDTIPTEKDFCKVVKDYLAWRVSEVLKQEGGNGLGKTEASLNAMLSSIEWGNFNVGDLFDVKSSVKRFDANKVVIKEQGRHPYVVRTSSNNGQKGFIDEDEKYLNNGNTISFGQDTATMFYQEKPYFTGDKIKIMKPKFEGFNKYNALFFITALTKGFSSFSWGTTSFSENSIKKQIISLPIKNNNIDFVFINKFIRTLEEERMNELEVYFLNAGLYDCNLTQDEKKAIDIVNSRRQKFQEFKLIDVFTISNSHNILKSDVVFGSGTTPYVTASEGNNSVVSYISYNPEMMEEGNTIMIGGKTLVITYQPNDYFSNDSHNLVLNIKDDEERNESTQLFMIAALYKTLKPKYSWGDSISKTKIQKDVVWLPVKEGSKAIDYSFMRTYISAIKKMCFSNLKDEIGKEHYA